MTPSMFTSNENMAYPVILPIVILLLSLSFLSMGYCASQKKVIGNGLENTDTVAINTNISNINNELINTVHRTGTETIRGSKTFSLPITGSISSSTYSSNGSPIGSITMYGASTAPSGWLVCDGSTYSITGTYSKLYAVIGTTYGSGSGYFGLPDMRGVFPKGAGTTNRVAGKDSSGNYYAATLGEYATDKMQGHKHAKNSTFTPGAPGSMIHSITDGTNNNASENVGVPVDDGTNGTPRTGHTTEPQSLGLTFIIKY